MVDFARIDSCKGCGETLEVLTTCVMCDLPSQFQCSNCSHFVDDPIHTNCVIAEDSI